MHKKVNWYIIIISILMISLLGSGRFGMADDMWDEDNAWEAEVFDEGDWEEGDSFGTEQYSAEIIEGGVRIVSCQMETVPETIQLPAELSYNNRSFPVLEIGEAAFSGIGEVKQIQVAEGIRQIGEYAFSGCEQLARLTIPKSVTSIGKGAFSECYALHTIEIDKANEHFSISDNCLYQDKKTLIWCSMEAEEAVLSEETEIIAEAAFSGCQLLTELRIPAAVTVIEENAFETCAALDTIYFQEQALFQLEKNSLPDLWNCVIYVENEEIKNMVEASEAYEGEEINVVARKEYALHYECNGGTLNEEGKKSYSNMEEIILPEPDKEGFLFLGWSETPEDTGEYIISYEAGTQGDKTLYAMWESDTDAEDSSLLNEAEQTLLLQKDGVSKAKNKSIKRSLVSARKKKQSLRTDESMEYMVRQKETEDSLAEAIEERAGQDSTVSSEETRTEQTEEEEQPEQTVEKQTKPQGRKPSLLVILLLSGGMLCLTGALGSMVYFHMQKKGK